MAFDPNAATAQYIDSLGPAALQKAHRLYHRQGMDVAMGGGRRSGRHLVDRPLRESSTASRRSCGEKRRNLSAFVIAFVYFVVSAILMLPWSVYADWWREKSYGRTSQPFSDWLFQLGIGTLVSAMIGAIFLIGVYWLIRRAGKRWWIWSGALVAVGFAFVALLSPVLIEPLFNHYTPVPPGQVHDAVVRWRAAPACRPSVCSCTTARASRITSPPTPAVSEARPASQSPTSPSKMRRSTRCAPSPGTRSAITY